MTGSIRSPYANAIAVAAAAAIVFEMVSAPVARHDVAMMRAASVSVQLQAAVVEEIGAVVGTESFVVTSTPSVAAAAVDPLAGLGEAVASIARTAINVVGVLLSPIWLLAAPITFGLRSLYGYVQPGFDPSGIFAAMTALANIGKWLTFPSRLGELFFPISAPGAAAVGRLTARREAGAATAPIGATKDFGSPSIRQRRTVQAKVAGTAARTTSSSRASRSAGTRTVATPARADANLKATQSTTDR